jgi:hypothetical protein
MSTKTNFKRVALVAVAALGLGVLTSVAPASAAADLATIEANGGSATAESNGLINSLDVDSTTAVGGGTDNPIETGDLTVTAKLTAGGRIAITTAGSHTNGAAVRVTGGLITAASVATSGSAALNTGGTAATASTTNAMTVVATPNGGAGTTMTIEIWNDKTDGYAAGADANTLVTVSIVAAGAQSVFAPTNSSTKFSVQAYAATTTYDTLDADYASYVDADETGATVTFKAYDAYGVDLPLALITCSATGAVLTSVGSQSATNFLSSSSSALQTTGVGYCSVKRAVRTAAVTSTVTISVNGVVFGTRSITFVGEAASIAVTSLISAPLSAASTARFSVSVKDSAGNKLYGKAIAHDASRYNASVTTASLSAATTAAISATSSTKGGWTCSATAGTANLRLVTYKYDGITPVYSSDIKAGCYGDPDSYTASFDKASYVPGDIATLTISAKDENGNVTNDSAVLGATGYDVSIAGSNMTAVVTPTNSDTFTAGSKTYKYIVGSTEGTYSMSVNLPNWNYTGGPQALTVPYKISGTGAVSNADVLKAIVSLIASINKQIAALQKALLKK